MMPSSGNATIGSSDVTSISTASVIHHVAIQTIIASVARAGVAERDGLPAASTIVDRAALSRAASASTRPGDEPDLAHPQRQQRTRGIVHRTPARCARCDSRSESARRALDQPIDVIQGSPMSRNAAMKITPKIAPSRQ